MECYSFIFCLFMQTFTKPECKSLFMERVLKARTIGSINIYYATFLQNLTFMTFNYRVLWERKIQLNRTSFYIFQQPQLLLRCKRIIFSLIVIENSQGKKSENFTLLKKKHFHKNEKREILSFNHYFQLLIFECLNKQLIINHEFITILAENRYIPSLYYQI